MLGSPTRRAPIEPLHPWAHLHFATNEDARRRLLQLGEAPERVFNTGSPGIDGLMQTPRWSREQLSERLDMPLGRQLVAVTFHPATLDPLSPEAQLAPLLEALGRLREAVTVVFTGANADSGGQTISQAIRAFSADRDNCCFIPSLGQAGYYSLVEQANLVVGNSAPNGAGAYIRNVGTFANNTVVGTQWPVAPELVAARNAPKSANGNAKTLWASLMSDAITAIAARPRAGAAALPASVGLVASSSLIARWYLRRFDDSGSRRLGSSSPARARRRRSSR